MNRGIKFKTAFKMVIKGRKFFNSKILPRITHPAKSDGEFFENLDDKKSLATKTKYSVSYINQLMKKQKIPFLKNGRSVRFIYSEVMAALKKESTL